MSADGGAPPFVKYSALSEFDQYHCNERRKKERRMIKLLTAVCIALGFTIILQAYHWNSRCEDENERAIIGQISVSIDRKSRNDFDNDKSGQGCTAGETKKVDCNTCICTPQGTFACTKVACVQTEEKIQGTEFATERCEPGTTVMKDCNTCTCNEHGRSYGCTKMACNGLHLNVTDFDNLEVGNK